jgi:hypothetical protein
LLQREFKVGRGFIEQHQQWVAQVHTRQRYSAGLTGAEAGALTSKRRVQPLGPAAQHLTQAGKSKGVQEILLARGGARSE